MVAAAGNSATTAAAGVAGKKAKQEVSAEEQARLDARAARFAPSTA